MVLPMSVSVRVFIKMSRPLLWLTKISGELVTIVMSIFDGLVGTNR